MSSGPTRLGSNMHDTGGSATREVFISDGKLFAMEGGNLVRVDVRAYDLEIRIGCTSVTREAFEYILKKVRNG